MDFGTIVVFCVVVWIATMLIGEPMRTLVRAVVGGILALLWIFASIVAQISAFLAFAIILVVAAVVLYAVYRFLRLIINETRSRR